MKLLPRNLIAAINGCIAYSEKSNTTNVLLSNGDKYWFRNKLSRVTNKPGWKPIGYCSPSGDFLLVESESDIL